jgi:hypothetical protein
MQEELMRTTIDIDEDVLQVAKEIARREGTSMGRVLSDLARQALTRRPDAATRNGVPLFPRRPGAPLVTLELVNQLRDEAP